MSCGAPTAAKALPRLGGPWRQQKEIGAAFSMFSWKFQLLERTDVG